MTTTEDAWHFARVLHNLPDTRQTRLAFHAGARHVLDRAIDAPASGNDEDLLELNEELIAFGKSIREASE